jgi:serine phosphatase RsbU (regulator of sigma subunit)
VHPEAAAATAAAALRAPSARAAMLALAPTSSASFALTARGHVHGYLDLYRGGDRPAMSESALGVAAQVAARAALALDNARLYSEQRGLAEALQRSLLTDPPEPADCEIAVRYEPAAEAASVGGDWFDSFLLAEGATVIAIGDVVGHNIEAAAAMGQLRGLLRGIAWTTGAGPAAVLGRLDAAIAGLALDTTATAVVACLEPAGGTAVGAGRRVLSWSNAGHPPPVMVDPSGRTTVLDHGAADLLLGIDAGTDRRESLVVLDPGATVVLYTDGLVERRGENLEVGIARLRTTLADTAGLTVEELCDRVLDRMLPGRADDDVALLALRVRVRPA